MVSTNFYQHVAPPELKHLHRFLTWRLSGVALGFARVYYDRTFGSERDVTARNILDSGFTIYTSFAYTRGEFTT